jgi:hypothetical protein
MPGTATAFVSAIVTSKEMKSRGTYQAVCKETITAR